MLTRFMYSYYNISLIVNKMNLSVNLIFLNDYLNFTELKNIINLINLIL